MTANISGLERGLRSHPEVAGVHSELDQLALAHYGVYLRIMGGAQRALVDAANLGWPLNYEPLSESAATAATKPTTLSWRGVKLEALTALSVPSYGIANLHITPSEALTVRELMLKDGDAITREALREVLGGDDPNSRAVDVHVTRLRGKLARQNPEAAGIIDTVRRVGYRMVAPVPSRSS